MREIICDKCKEKTGDVPYGIEFTFRRRSIHEFDLCEICWEDFYRFSQKFAKEMEQKYD